MSGGILFYRHVAPLEQSVLFSTLLKIRESYPPDKGIKGVILIQTILQSNGNSGRRTS